MRQVKRETDGGADHDLGRGHEEGFGPRCCDRAGDAIGVLSPKVADNGIGIPDSEVRGRKSLGLLGMQERAQLSGGEVSILGAPGRGTTVSVSIPMPRLQG